MTRKAEHLLWFVEDDIREEAHFIGKEPPSYVAYL